MQPLLRPASPHPSVDNRRRPAFTVSRFLLWAGCLTGAISPGLAQDSTVLSQGPYRVVRQGGENWIYQLSDRDAGSLVEVHRQGANIRRFEVTVRGVRYSVLSSSGAPKLMPWPNRTRAGKFLDAAGKEQSLFVRDGQGNLLTSQDGLGNALHGMVEKRQWRVEDFGVDADGVFLRCYFETRGFPALESLFGAFRDYTVYRLKGNRLILDAYVRNNADKAFPNCGWGWHPWFNAPLVPVQSTQRGSKARCSLLMPARRVAVTGPDKIPTGEYPSVASHLGGRFDFTRLRPLDRSDVDHFYSDLEPAPGMGHTRSVLIDYGNAVRVQMLAQFPAYSWMVLYIPGQNVVAVEPQTEEVNGLNTRQSLINIPAGGQSPMARVVIEADGDTTLSVPPVSAAGLRPRWANPGVSRLAWPGLGNILVWEPSRGRTFHVSGSARIRPGPPGL